MSEDYADFEQDDADFQADCAAAEQQLRRYGFGYLEQKNEEQWLGLVDILRRHYNEHMEFPGEEELPELWRQEVRAEAKRLREFLGLANSNGDTLQ